MLTKHIFLGILAFALALIVANLVYPDARDATKLICAMTGVFWFLFSVASVSNQPRKYKR